MTESEHQRDYRELINKVKRLTPKEKNHILSIFKKYNIEFTKNSNGYFFNLDKIESHIIDKVSKCVDLIEQKRELIQSLDKKRDYYLEYYKTLIENKLKETINKKKEQYLNQLMLIPTETYISKKKSRRNRVVINGDPDVLMKEHLKGKKYDKNSVYFRLTQIMNSLAKRHLHKSSKMDRDHGEVRDDGEMGSFNYGEGDIEGGDLDIEGGDDKISIRGTDLDEEGLGMEDDSGEHKFDDEDEVEDEDDEDVLKTDGDYGDREEHSDIDDDEYYKDSSSDVETNDNKTEKTDRTEKTTKTNKTKKTKTKKSKKDDKTHEASSNELDYYKSLLKQNGFLFQDDKIALKKEEYII